MAKFRKKPVMIEAIRFTGAFSVDEMLEEWGDPFGLVSEFDYKMCELHIRTLESHKAPLTAIKGDWIIRGVQGEFYPCNADIFEKTYEPA